MEGTRGNHINRQKKLDKERHVLQFLSHIWWYGLDMKCPLQSIVLKFRSLDGSTILGVSENIKKWGLAGGSRSQGDSTWEYFVPGLFLPPTSCFLSTMK
jgi:hypothetical protein